MTSHKYVPGVQGSNKEKKKRQDDKTRQDNKSRLLRERKEVQRGRDGAWAPGKRQARGYTSLMCISEFLYQHC